jgi:hypothetical protein
MKYGIISTQLQDSSFYRSVESSSWPRDRLPVDMSLSLGPAAPTHICHIERMFQYLLEDPPPYSAVR